MRLLKRYIHLILLLGILILAFRIRYIDSIYLADLKPWHDSFEYSLSAYNLYHHHIYAFKCFGHYYPPQYPFGYPLLIIPFYIVFGSQPYNAVYCSLFFAMLSIVFAYLIGRELGNRFTGLMAALFVALCPWHIVYSKYIMTESLSTFFTLFICWVLLKTIYVDSKRQGLLLLFLGIIAGFSVLVHLSNCLLIPPILISLLLGRKSNPWSIIKKETIILLGIILALIPMCLYQFHTFGSPLMTGFHAWFPEHFEKLRSFSFEFFIHPYLHYKSGNFVALLFDLTGLDNPFYPATMVPLLLGGFLFILYERRKPHKRMIFLIFSSLLILSLFIFFSFYHMQASRFLLLGIPLLMILAACGATFFIDKGIFKTLTKGSIFSITILSLFLMTILQMTIWSCSLPKSSLKIDNHQYKLIQDINRHIPNNAVIISQLNSIIAEHYSTEHTEDKITYIALSKTLFLSKMAMGYIKPIRYDRAKKYSFLFSHRGDLNPRTYNFIRQSLREGIPVYLVYLPDFPSSTRLLPFIKIYFSLIEQKGDSRLFRLYLKDW